MKRLLLLPILLLSANAANAQEVLLKCSVDYTGTEIHKFYFKPTGDSIYWTDSSKKRSKGQLTTYSTFYIAVFRDNLKTTDVMISRLNGLVAITEEYADGRVVEIDGQCTKAPAPKVMF